MNSKVARSVKMFLWNSSARKRKRTSECVEVDSKPHDKIADDNSRQTPESEGERVPETLRDASGRVRPSLVHRGIWIDALSSDRSNECKIHPHASGVAYFTCSAMDGFGGSGSYKSWYSRKTLKSLAASKLSPRILFSGQHSASRR